MKILIDLQHPAHLHFFRNVVNQLRAEGHEVRLTGRDKDILVSLAGEYGLEVEVFGTAKSGILKMGSELFGRWWRLWHIARRWKPDRMMAIAGTYASLPGWLTGTPVSVFYDTEHAMLSNLLAYPFCTCVHVPRCYKKNIRWNHRRYNGYHELAYLHPKYFTPNPSVLEEVGIGKDVNFTLVRFVGWGAAHDIGRRGFTAENRVKAVRELQEFGSVLISCEGELPSDLEDCRLQLPVSRIHDLMYYAALVFGESATMSSEAAVLGVPSVYVYPVGLGYTDEQEREYGLVSHFTHEQEEEAIERGRDILNNYSRDKWRDKAKRLVEDKIDVSQMLCDIARQGDGVSV
ncbi:MAG: DUF354 domain-containing protein [Desulfatiglandaceae bacterium]